MYDQDLKTYLMFSEQTTALQTTRKSLVCVKLFLGSRRMMRHKEGAGRSETPSKVAQQEKRRAEGEKRGELQNFSIGFEFDPMIPEDWDSSEFFRYVSSSSPFPSEALQVHGKVYEATKKKS